MKTLRDLEIKNIFLILALILITYMALTIFLPYLNIIIISLVIVQIFQPVYRLIYLHSKSKALSTTLSIFIAIFFMIIPIVFLVILALSEIGRLTQDSNLVGNLGDIQASLNITIDSINKFLTDAGLDYSISHLDFGTLVLSSVGSIQDQLVPFVQQILTLSGTIIFNLFLLIICLIYFFPMYDRLPEIFSRISPLDNKLDKILYTNFRATTKGVIKGGLFVAVLQATAVLIPLLIINTPAPILLWAIMVILSILPIGSGLVWGPVGLFMIIDGIRTGNPAQVIIAIALIIYSAVIINVIDTVIRPRVMRNSVNIHPLVTIFSVLGGLYYFGPLGILYGPLIIVFFISIIDIYHKNFLENKSYLNTDL